jgi:plastocyanin
MLRTPAAAVTGLLAIGVAACGSSATSTSAPNTGATGGAAAVTVKAHDFGFDVSGAASPSGTVNVSFMNSGPSEHSFTLDSGGTEVEAESGNTKTVSFSAPASGDIKFHCKYHSSMHGTISAGAGGAAGTSSSSSSNGYGY